MHVMDQMILNYEHRKSGTSKAEGQPLKRQKKNNHNNKDMAIIEPFMTARAMF